jgi:hypothetical protein
MSLARHLRAFRHVVGRRGAALLCFAILDAVYAAGLVWPGPNGGGATQVWFGSILPLWFWALWWLSATVVCTVGALNKRYDQAGFIAAISIKIWWGVLGLIGWIAGQVPVSAPAVWLGLSVLVMLIAGWPEPEHHVIEGEVGRGGD